MTADLTGKNQNKFLVFSKKATLTMSNYNIIFTSPDNDPYLWNGTSFDKLENEDRESLFYSGISIEEGKVTEALKKSRAAAKKLFPGDKAPGMKAVEIKVS